MDDAVKSIDGLQKHTIKRRTIVNKSVTNVDQLPLLRFF